MSKALQVIRKQRYNEQRGRCYYCHNVMWEPGFGETEEQALERVQAYRPGVQSSNDGKAMRLSTCTAEHLERQADGGTNDPRNVVAACRYCNSARDTRPVRDWKQAILDRQTWTQKMREPLPSGYYEPAFTKQTVVADWNYVFFVEAPAIDLFAWRMNLEAPSQQAGWKGKETAIQNSHALVYEDGQPKRIEGYIVLCESADDAREFAVAFLQQIVGFTFREAHNQPQAFAVQDHSQETAVT